MKNFDLYQQQMLQNAGLYNAAAYQKAAFANAYGTSTAAQHLPYQFTVQPSPSEEDVKRIIKEEIAKHLSVVELADPGHAHFMIRGLHEDYCMCGYRVKR